jgi:2-keto-3-deoxy-L-rhamnonate aldolase RhmA
VSVLRQTLDSRPVLGTFVKIPRAEIVDLLALSGLDFAVCDYEHGQMDERDVLETLRAARGAQLPMVVRVADLDRGGINRMLEAGAAGIQLARTVGATGPALAALLHYPPEGSRSLSTVQPSALYGRVAIGEHIARANADVLAVGQFETANYADGLDDAIAALDVAFIGPVDLTVDLGAPGDTGAPAVRGAIADIEHAAARTETALGIYAADAQAALVALAAGYRYVVISSDIAMLAAGAAQLIGAVRPR